MQMVATNGVFLALPKGASINYHSQAIIWFIKALLGEENERPKRMLLHIPCRDGGVKSGVQSYEAEVWTTFKLSLWLWINMCTYWWLSISCVGDHATYHGITIMWEAIVCLWNPHSEWYAGDCMFGTCGNCGVN
jgi:hypothetical protein